MKLLKFLLVIILLVFAYRYAKKKGWFDKLKSAIPDSFKPSGASSTGGFSSLFSDDESNKDLARDLADSLIGMNDKTNARRLLMTIKSDDQFNEVSNFFRLFNKNGRTLLEQMKRELFIPNIKKDVNNYYASVGMFSKV